MTLDELRNAVAAGEIDTVLLALTDMQGRLQGKRFTARHFLDAVLGHGAEACNYLLAVDVEMNTVDGYAMSSWEHGYGDFEMKPDLDDAAPHPVAGGHGAVLADLQWHDGTPVVASPRQILRAQLDRLAERGWTRARAPPSSSSWSSAPPTTRRTCRATATSSRPTSTTSTTRCSAPRGSSR